MKTFINCLSVALLAVYCQGQCLTANDDLNVENPPIPDTLPFTDFSLTLFKEIFPYNTSTNFFFSPYSIWNALTLAYFGAEGNTEKELAKVLGHKDKVSAITLWRTISFIYTMRQKDNKDITLRLANRAYFDDSVSLRPCMKEILKDEIKTLNLLSQPKESATEINEFVSNVTKGRISELVTPADLANSHMALINAAFFKGTWMFQFKESNTKKKLFYMSSEDYTFVNMMVQKGNFRHGVSEKIGAHVLEIPYTKDTVSMFILLPPFIRGPKGFDSMVKNINAETLTTALEDIYRSEIEIQIPKFKLAQNVGDELITGLKNMGIKDVFDSNAANLTGYSTNGGLSIGKSIHKAFLEINEEGTEAAAATAFVAFRSARPLSPSKFHCNHPFMIIIKDTVTGNILFMGAYKNPKA